jgi:hypothetical protein
MIRSGAPPTEWAQSIGGKRNNRREGNMTTGKYELKRIGVFSLAKTLFLVGGISGFVIGILEWILIGLIFWASRNAPIDPGLFGQSGMGDLVGAGIGAIGFFLPIIGAIGGAVGGVVFGFILGVVYNLSARMWGGIELEWGQPAAAAMVKTAPTPPAARAEATPLPDSSQRASSPQTGGTETDTDPASNRSSSAMYE